jgi:outer membrane protein assembly factor BamB
MRNPAASPRLIGLVVSLVLVHSLGSPLRASDPVWPGLRGPGALGTVEAGFPPPVRWQIDQNIEWSTAIPGRAWSSPIVSGKRVFLTTAVNSGPDVEPKKGLYFGGDRKEPVPHSHEWRVIGLSLESGRVEWERLAHSGVPTSPIHIKNSYATETPVTDGERVYAYFGNVGLFAYTVEGEPVWERRWPSVATRYGWGTAASPVLHGDRIYIVNDNEDASWIAAIDKKTGDVAWKLDREEKSNWATPFVWSHGGHAEIVTAGTQKVRSYGLDGKIIWELSGMSSITIGTPYAKHSLLFISSGYVGDQLRPIYAIRAGAEGDISLREGETSNASIAWSHPKAAPYNPTTIVYGDHLYTLLDRGFFTCHDARTGTLIYDKQRLGKGNAFTSSPWAYGGHIFCLSEDGDTFIVRAGKDFEVIGVNALGEMCMATPAIADDRLIVRSLSKLWSIRRTPTALPPK